MHEDRILLPELRNRIMTADEAAALIKPGMTIGASGFTAVGYPKSVPKALARQGSAKGLRVIAGASCGDEMDGELARAGLMSFRAPFNINADVRRRINDGTIGYVDMHLSRVPQAVRNGILGKPDVAIIECCMVTEDGDVVPTLSVGASGSFLDTADKIILECNLSHPTDLYGMHDICNVDSDLSKDFPLIKSISDQIGERAMRCDPAKIAGIVITNTPDQEPRFLEPDDVSIRIAQHVVDLLRQEMRQKRIHPGFTIQSGFGAVANAVLGDLACDEFGKLNMYTEVAQDAALELLLQGKISFISATSLCLSRKGRALLYDNLALLRECIVLRPQDISNDGGIIRQMGLVAMNTAIEVDIYGNVNSTHIMGSGIMNGIGGSGDFARNSAISIFMTSSVAKDGDISCIVPMVSHVDHTEHDVQFIVTEQGVADLRGKSPNERAALLIERCAHPDYRSALREYYEWAKRETQAKHTPHDFKCALSWHQNYLSKGKML